MAKPIGSQVKCEGGITRNELRALRNGEDADKKGVEGALQ